MFAMTVKHAYNREASKENHQRALANAYERKLQRKIAREEAAQAATEAAEGTLLKMSHQV